MAYTDGIIPLFSTEALTTIYLTLHETKHADPKGADPGIPTGNLTRSEEDLYEAAGAELGARIRNSWSAVRLEDKK